MDRAPAAPAAALRVVAIGLSVAAATFFVPFWAPLVLAAWFADLFGPAQRRLERGLGGKRRGATIVVVVFVIAVLAPVIAVGLALVSHVGALLEQASAALREGGSLRVVLLGNTSDATDLASVATRSAENAWHAATAVARASAIVAVDALLFVAGLYSFLAHGRDAYEWLAERSPIPRSAFARLAAAFRETGRGLLVASGGTALVQGAVATAAYATIGIPRAFLLGPLTAVGAIVPAIGTAVVWLPLAIELALSGSYGRAGLVVIAGVVTSTVDNVVRPFLARHGRLTLPVFVVFASMLGGVALVGPAGALLGPLVVRLAVEALDILRDERLGRREPSHQSTVASEPPNAEGIPA